MPDQKPENLLPNGFPVNLTDRLEPKTVRRNGPQDSSLLKETVVLFTPSFNGIILTHPCSSMAFGGRVYCSFLDFGHGHVNCFDSGKLANMMQTEAWNLYA